MNIAVIRGHAAKLQQALDAARARIEDKESEGERDGERIEALHVAEEDLESLMDNLNSAWE